jgi:hypothetical protein
VVPTLEPNPTPKEIIHEAKSQLIKTFTLCFMAGAQMLNSTRRTLELPYKRWGTSLTREVFFQGELDQIGDLEKMIPVRESEGLLVQKVSLFSKSCPLLKFAL